VNEDFVDFAIGELGFSFRALRPSHCEPIISRHHGNWRRPKW
jgi:hypothetical protein